MTALLAALLTVHAGVHLLGVAKAFGFADLPQLAQPISNASGAMWLGSALLFGSAAVCLFAWPRGWWILGAIAITVSTTAILPPWQDAKFGAAVNAGVLIAVSFGFLAQGPFSLRAAYDQDVRTGVSHTAATPVIRESDLDHLPLAVRRYLQASGVVGQPRVYNFRARMHGRIRNGPTARWMPIAAEQYNFFEPHSRFFYLTGSMLSIPVQGYHRYAGTTATMLVKAAALVPVAEAAGEEMSRAETVTLFNDMCVMAPATLIDPRIVWTPMDAHNVRAEFTNAGHTIRAELAFNGAGELTNFQSADRYAVSPDGRTVKPIPWSTPLGGYRNFGPVRLAATGEGRWHEPGGEYAYIEVTIDDVRYNVRR